MSLSEYLAANGDRRYVDRDVREHPELVSVATNFLYAYGGDFRFLVDAQELLRSTGFLPIATTRGVLNCMRVDPLAVRTLPVPPSGAPLAVVSPLTQWRECQEPAVLRRPARVRLQATFKKQYLISTYPTAQTFHLLDTERCQLWWMPFRDEYEARLFVLCKRSIYPPNILMTDEVPEGRRICTGCYRHTVGG